ncbi:hypothetical protein [Aeromonas salmonicida]|uniref:hypothetical protein n=1 Tax=Aeromonas salmonicida TaxID=645 RepID=UPI0015EC59FD|nr:hypothetical protein [Aeromonas salmonicida]
MMDARKLLINLLYLATAQSSELPGWSHRETKKDPALYSTGSLLSPHQGHHQNERLGALSFPAVQPYFDLILSLLVSQDHVGYFSDICQFTKRSIAHHIKSFVAFGPPKSKEPVCSIHFLSLHLSRTR